MKTVQTGGPYDFNNDFYLLTGFLSYPFRCAPSFKQRGKSKASLRFETRGTDRLSKLRTGIIEQSRTPMMPVM